MFSMPQYNTFRDILLTPRVNYFCVQSNTMKTVGERIRQARVAHKLTGEELAKKAGYKRQSAIANLENRATGTGGNKINDIADALCVSVEWLLRGPDGPNVPFLPGLNIGDGDTNTDIAVNEIAASNVQKIGTNSPFEQSYDPWTASQE